MQFLGGGLLKEISGCTKMEIIAHLGVISRKLTPLGEFITSNTVGEVETQENLSYVDILFLSLIWFLISCYTSPSASLFPRIYFYFLKIKCIAPNFD